MLIEEYINTKNPDDYLVSTINTIHTEGPVSLELLELLSYMKEFHPQTFSVYEKQLVYILGLFFKTTEPETLLQEIYNIFSNSIKEEFGRSFTPVQASLYQKISENRYYSFSSPTSSGKSYLFKQLISDEKGDIVIIVPSRALIAEYLNTVKVILKNDTSVLVLQFAENVNQSKTSKRVYILTPERANELFKIHKELNITLFLFDEAQISEENIRGLRFDALVRRADKLIPLARKVFAHPFVLNPEAQLKKHKFDNNSKSFNFKQHAVGKIYLSHIDGKFDFFSPFVKKERRTFINSKVDLVESVIRRNGTALIYVAKTAIYSKEYLNTFEKYIGLCPNITDINAIEIVEELKSFIGASDSLSDKHSILVDLMYKGIVIHHGSIPLYVRLLIEQFVNGKHAKICFSTSTLIQGINMPFDIVWIDNFRFEGNADRKTLDLKNLIGRAGRTTLNKDVFDYGYVIVEQKNVDSFCKRMVKDSKLKSNSQLDEKLENIPEDLYDTAEAIIEDSFNDDLNLTESQIERISKSKLSPNIKFILDNLLPEGIPLKGNDYTILKKSAKDKIKNNFRKIFVSHLKRKELKIGELRVLSASIPILLWRIQGKSFNEIVSLRHSYITEKSLRLSINKKFKNGEISPSDYQLEIDKIELKYSVQASPLPNYYAKKISLFPIKSTMKNFEYDLLVYDTYDYLDKVISQSLADPLSAAFQIYFREIGDPRALAMSNYIKYGTNNPVEIWLLRYGFGFEEIDWLFPLVKSIDERQIIFNNEIESLDSKKKKIIERYL